MSRTFNLGDVIAVANQGNYVVIDKDDSSVILAPATMESEDWQVSIGTSGEGYEVIECLIIQPVKLIIGATAYLLQSALLKIADGKQLHVNAPVSQPIVSLVANLDHFVVVDRADEPVDLEVWGNSE